MATFVLVHGAGHGGWCYFKVAPLLRKAGHDVYTPTLTGLGERKHLLTTQTDLSTHVTDIVNALIYEDLQDVILAGHSYGGMVITGVADRVPDRIREMVFLDAAHPGDGQSLVDIAPATMAFARMSSKVVDDIELVMWPDEAMIAAMGVSDPADLAMLRTKMMPHPWKAFEERLHFENADVASKIPRTNVNCITTMSASTDIDSGRQTAGLRNFEINTGHDLMITEPRRVADMLLEVAAG